ncbi:bifunctional folylpolyglutamate synthase/dihydrofolate synthase [Leuconostoc litchii]|uniref:tetrahydrofolate synthase n=1 Tax=Leuconostoc litchii TaxID=1981069 RepID=A0A6P2CT87_9LACO|nr:folylpolyglutamate synthase/dihydrofolate synthase family protein [Leuconostoc litchii]TYC47459.1 bifunctional folylpolyglutamate synthase/dihydrofolate synthase [Leuconostoc litchii]GMA69478.1 bifunctional folylpolyglutamate synthase/dihydrofolate synthase [Leuconostoc litchii]
MKTVEEAIAYIHNRPKGGRKESLYRMKALLAALDNPQNQLPKAIHITGTNGKGSVSTMVSNILRVAGYDTGLFVSPFITNFRERIQINNELIPEADLVATTKIVAKALVDVDKELFPDIPLEFEVLTAVMLTYFASKNLDAVVIEVGIGGLLDSTNVLSKTKVAVVTSVGLDHQKMLGNTISEIAAQKSGIIHDESTVVIGDLPAEACKVIEEKASGVIKGKKNEFKSGLPGQYQIENTATAVATVRAFDQQISNHCIQSGLNESIFAGRYELIQPNIMLDGAHNAQGIRALYQSLITSYPNKKISLIIGSLMDKNVSVEFDEILKNKWFNIVLVPFVGPNGRQGLSVEKTIAMYPQISTVSNWHQAVEKSRASLTVLTGSLYFVSEVREYYAR